MFKEKAIEVRDLSKMYTVYNNKKYKLFDALNMPFFIPKNASKEFWALRDINFTVNKGEKVGLIGRNGAGKSTLLRTIIGNTSPTSGKVQVNGNISALLEIGTGFHPELTGRENVLTSLNYMGITGRKALEKYEEILDFSELEDFINQPIKTYSAGMYTRLAFSVSTSIEPDIIVIDEILGAGDAYFIKKSIDRMKKITAGGTTVLFVSHDISSVQSLCERAIWIDKGKMLLDSDTLSVSKAYAASIREQEEIRLTAKNLRLMQKDLKNIFMDQYKSLIFHFVTENEHPRSKHPIHKITLLYNNKTISVIDLGDAMDNDDTSSGYIIHGSDIDWSKPSKLDGKYVRFYENLNGRYCHAPFVFNVSADLLKYNSELELLVEYKDISDEVVKIEVYDGESYKTLHILNSEDSGQWKKATVSLADDNLFTLLNGQNNIKINQQLSENVDMKEESTQYKEKALYCSEVGVSDTDDTINKLSEETLESLSNTDNTMLREEYVISAKNSVYGSGEVLITSFKMMDYRKQNRNIFTTGEQVYIQIDYNALKKVKNPVFVVAVYLMDGNCACQIISRKDKFEVGEINGVGSIILELNPLLLGKGTYVCSVAIFKDLSLSDSVEPDAYQLHDRMYEFRVEQPTGVNVGLGICVHPVKWRSENG